MERVGLRYRRNRARDHYDVIVIGSGMGGLTCASLMAKMGRRVCVLEQHYTAGGFTHSYERNGYEWDVGVHYIGEVHKPHSPVRRLFDVISDGRIEWAAMDEVYDRIILGDRKYDFRAGSDNFAADLKARFPGEEKAIDRYIALVRKVARSSQRFFMGQALPPLLARLYNRIRGLLVPRECLMPTRQVLESLTQNQELIGVLTGQWGDYGLLPADAAFLMHCVLVKHYFGGGYYPVGGAQKISEHILPVIREAGGEVFTYARVREILIEDGRAAGVVLENGDQLRADQVVSNAGALNTFGKLLPEAQRRKHGYDRKLKQVKPSSAHLCLYVGLKGTAKQLGLPKTNLWVYPSAQHEWNVQCFLQNPDLEFPMVYISFPSAKDPAWEKHYPDRSTIEVLTLGPYEWFEQWAGSTWNDRGAEYEKKKEQFSQRLLQALYKQMPQLEGKVDFYELSTPLSTQWFQLNDRGEIYGLDHDAGRFRQNWLQATTEVKGLYLTGQDVITAGVGGALVAGMVTSMAMLGSESVKLKKLLKEWKPQADEGTAIPVTA
jgi:all-trans-retinol 13,14-reductase